MPCKTAGPGSRLKNPASLRSLADRDDGDASPAYRQHDFAPRRANPRGACAMDGGGRVGADLRALRERVRWLEGRLQCPLCHALPIAPVALARCGHHFCSVCVRSYLSTRSICPLPGCGAAAATTALLPLRQLDCGAVSGGGSAAADDVPRLPHITSNAALLRDRLREAGVSTAGNLARLEGRHRVYVIAYNAALDGRRSAAQRRAEVAESVRAYDRAMDATEAAAVRARSGAATGMFRSRGGGVAGLLGKRGRAVDETREMSEVLCAGDGDAGGGVDGEGGDADVVLSPVRIGDSFDELIRKTRLRKRERARGGVLGGGTGSGRKVPALCETGTTKSGKREGEGGWHRGCEVEAVGGDDVEVMDVNENETDSLCAPTPPESPLRVDEQSDEEVAGKSGLGAFKDPVVAVAEESVPAAVDGADVVPEEVTSQALVAEEHGAQPAVIVSPYFSGAMNSLPAPAIAVQPVPAPSPVKREENAYHSSGDASATLSGHVSVVTLTEKPQSSGSNASSDDNTLLKSSASPAIVRSQENNELPLPNPLYAVGTFETPDAASTPRSQGSPRTPASREEIEWKKREALKRQEIARRKRAAQALKRQALSRRAPAAATPAGGRRDEQPNRPR
jgi:Zinc finger, C3HC4 type (RING finger)